MIPKKIHYCWFGEKSIPKQYEKYIEGWKNICPDYEIIKWNEKNYDLTKHKYMKQAYDNKKWAFVSDYARLDIIYEYGGIYLDTDVEIIRNLDYLLENKGFVGLTANGVNTGLIFAAEKNLPIVKKLRDYYDSVSFINHDGTLNLTTCTEHQTALLLKLGLKRRDVKQKVYDLKIYPSEYFSPKNRNEDTFDITDRTYTIHHGGGSWKEAKQVVLEKKLIREKYILYERLRKYLGSHLARMLVAVLVSFKNKRFFSALKKYTYRFK